jgi:error-prone DNA polymerase
MPLGEHVVHDYRSLGLSLKEHPVTFLRDRLTRAGITPNAHLPSVRDGRRVSVAGLVLVRQRPGKGNAIFVTLEDEKSIANVIIWPRVFDRFRPVVMGARFIRVTGKLQHESDVIHIVADRIEDLTPWLSVLLHEAAPTIEHRPGETRPDRSADPGRGLPVEQDVATLSSEARQVMPKGRNFQ